MPLLFDSLFSSVALSHLMVDAFNSSRPVLLTYLGLTETQIALISTIYICASALTQPFFGWLSDRIGPTMLAGACTGSVLPYHPGTDNGIGAGCCSAGAYAEAEGGKLERSSQNK